jgi:hypothetical protein
MKRCAIGWTRTDPNHPSFPNHVKPPKKHTHLESDYGDAKALVGNIEHTSGRNRYE